MLRTCSLLALLMAIASPAFAGLLDARVGGAGRPANTSMSVGIQVDYATLKDVDDAKTIGSIMDLQVPIPGVGPARLRAPLVFQAPEGAEKGMGNVMVGIARGFELGLGIETAFAVGVDVAVHTAKDGVGSFNLLRGPEFSGENMVMPHVTFGVDTPVIDAKISADYVLGVGDQKTKAMRISAVGAFAVMPLFSAALAVDVIKPMGDGAGDPSILAAPGLRMSLPPLVDLGLHIPLAVSGPAKDTAGLGVTLDASVGF